MTADSISCIILAGGESKRMNGEDKGLIDFNGQPLISHVINALQNQVDDFVISANRNIELYQQFSTNVIPDDSEMRGPLSGIAAALPSCKHEWVLIIPCDMPHLPNDLVDKLVAEIDHSEIVIIEVLQRFQLVFLMNKSLLTSVQEHLASGKHKLMQWVTSCSPAIVDYSNSVQAFRNINSVHDLEQTQLKNS